MKLKTIIKPLSAIFLLLFSFYYTNKVGYCYSDSGFLGCATEEIARHFGKYFGMLITEAKYGDLKDFEIVDNYYKN